MWGFGDNKEKDTSKVPQKKLKGGSDAPVGSIKKAKKVMGGSATDRRMCAAGFKKHCK